LQEDKMPLFDTVDTVQTSVRIMAEVVHGMQVRRDRMLTAVQDGFMNATDLADYLVGRGVAFRDAHAIAGRIVSHCATKNCRIEGLTLQELKMFSAKIEKDLYSFLSAESVVDRRRALGGTSRANVLRRLKELGA
jgi:argininosuccinate lyase